MELVVDLFDMEPDCSDRDAESVGDQFTAQPVDQGDDDLLFPAGKGSEGLFFPAGFKILDHLPAQGSFPCRNRQSGIKGSPVRFKDAGNR